MPLIVHFTDFNCKEVIWHSTPEMHRFTLVFQRKQIAFAAELHITVCINHSQTELTYSMPTNLKMARYIDVPINYIPCDHAIALLGLYLANRGAVNFVHRCDLLHYVLLLSDTHVLDDYIHDAFTFRCLADKLLTEAPIGKLLRYNRHMIVSSVIAEHLANTEHDSYHSFIEAAYLTPGIYKWLQQQPLAMLPPSEYQQGLTFQGKAFTTLLQLSIKARNAALNTNFIYHDLLCVIEALEAREDDYFFIEQMPFIELIQFQVAHQYPLKTYMADMFDMQMSLNPEDLSVTTIKTAKQLRKYHDTLSRLTASSRILPADIDEDTVFPVSPVSDTAWLKQIKDVKALFNEAETMHHCIGSKRYINKLMTGKAFAYKVYGKTRATALGEIVAGLRGTKLALTEVSGKHNSHVDNVTRQKVLEHFSHFEEPRMVIMAEKK